MKLGYEISITTLTNILRSYFEAPRYESRWVKIGIFFQRKLRGDGWYFRRRRILRKEAKHRFKRQMKNPNFYLPPKQGEGCWSSKLVIYGDGIE